MGGEVKRFRLRATPPWMAWHADGHTPSTPSILLVCVCVPFSPRCDSRLVFVSSFCRVYSLCSTFLYFSLEWLVCASFVSSVHVESRRSVLGWGERLRLCLYWVDGSRALQRTLMLVVGWLQRKWRQSGKGVGTWEVAVGGSTVSPRALASDSTPRATGCPFCVETNDRLATVVPTPFAGTPRSS